ncbi:hypothetical protein [Mesorhizobium mediterraneum]|uniref:hypothetical protein n=1 Tax=Mesorhizobium mediterraneum TaxID=43617 RepID=UPI00177FD155|nr:hypothetical protein [Mesorhizobium mediterraneum]
MIKFGAAIASLAMLFGAADASHAQQGGRQVNLGWKISCSVDRGAIERGRSSYIFRKSRNHCSGGIYKQRSEIYTSKFSVNRRVNYLFDSEISLTSSSSEEAIIFQIHDGRRGCSPPLSLRWTRGNTFRFDSDYTRGMGMKGCVRNSSLRNAQYSGPSLRRNGARYRLQVALAFDGHGSFDVDVLVNGRKVIGGRYQPPSDPQYVASKQFYMKHGVYSQNIFDYEMRSEGMRVSAW